VVEVLMKFQVDTEEESKKTEDFFETLFNGKKKIFNP